MRVEIFTEIGSGKKLQKEINTWMEESGLGPEDVWTVTQSECGTAQEGQVTISIWYIPRSVEPAAAERDFISQLANLDDEVPF